MQSLDDATPRILHLDIETAPHRVYAWGLWNQNIGINQIVEPGYTLCFAAQWDDDPEHYYFHSVWDDGFEGMIAAAHELLDEADAVVHFNGKKFDIPTLNREFLLQGLAPPSDYWQIDLYQVVRKTFRFASNKLDYVCKQLGIGAKIENKGMELWDEVMRGVPESCAQMEEYNIHDVELLPLLYRRLLPWIGQHPNMGLWQASQPDQLPTCTNCGSHNVHQKGYRTTQVSVYPRFRCMDCGHWMRGRKRARLTHDGVLT